MFQATRRRRTSPRLAALAVWPLLLTAAAGASPTRSLTPAPSHSLQEDARRRLGKTPLYFEPNEGQADPAVRYLARGNGFTILLTGTEAVFVNTGTRQPVRLRFEGARAPERAELLEPIPGVSNYLRGKDAAKWRTDVPHFGRARFYNVYPGIDLLFYSNEGRLEYDLIVAPGADPSAVRIHWDSVDSTKLEASGDLVVSTSAGDLRHKRPTVYQEIDGKRREVAAAYSARGGNRYGFQLGRWDRSAPLVIDPLLLYSTYLGGSQADEVLGVAIDPGGNTYFTGYTASTEFPLAGAIRTTVQGISEAFITKLSFDGNFVLYSTFIGGEQEDKSQAIAVDLNGVAYITGVTTSFGFPATNGALQQNFSGAPNDAFMLKLNAAGNQILYATYLGTGDTEDRGNGIAVDVSGNWVVVGDTRSTGLPTTPGAIKRTNNGSTDGFVIKFNANSDVVFLTYLGGTSDEGLNGVALDYGSEIYVVGATLSNDFPTTPGAYDTSANGGADAFVAKISQNGKKLQWSTYFGSDGFDIGLGIALEPGGRVLVTGRAGSSTNPFPTTGQAYRTTTGGIEDGFVARFNTTGTKLLMSTLIGTSAQDWAADVKPAPGGFVVVSGQTKSNNFPSTTDAFQFGVNFNGDVFIQVLAPLGNAFTFSSILGGTNEDVPREMAMDAFGSYYVVGQTYSGNYPTQNALDTTFGGNFDGFITKFNGVNTGDCVATIAPTGTNYQVEGGAGGAGVGAGCIWYAYSSTNWVTLSSDPLTNGAGSLNYTVGANAGTEPRTASVQVAGNLVHLLQKGTTNAAPFQDVPTSDPFVDYVQLLKSNAITSGCSGNNYCPGDVTTRGQMAVFLIRSLVLTDDFDFPPAPYFEDVPATHPQFKWIQKLRSLGITTGCTTLRYCPNDPVTRGQMAVFLVRSRFGETFTSPATPYFTDVPANQTFFRYIQKLRQLGVTTGCTANTYCINDPTTRGQMAVFLARAYLTPW